MKTAGYNSAFKCLERKMLKNSSALKMQAMQNNTTEQI